MKKVLLLVVAFAMAISMNAQIFSDDFQDGDISDWTTVSIYYNDAPFTWHVTSYSGDYYLTAAAYQAPDNFQSEQWIISPSFDASGISTIDVTFDNRARYTPYQDIECYVSTDFAGDSASFDAATWVEVTGFSVDSDDSDYDWEVGTTGSASITGTANTYVAYKFVSIDGTAGNWTINNVVVTEGTSAVNEISNSVSVYPNPVVSTLNISDASDVVIFNIAGQEIMNVSNTTSVNVANLDAGVYFAQVTNQEGTSVKKIIKK